MAEKMSCLQSFMLGIILMKFALLSFGSEKIMIGVGGNPTKVQQSQPLCWELPGERWRRLVVGKGVLLRLGTGTCLTQSQQDGEIN